MKKVIIITGKATKAEQRELLNKLKEHRVATKETVTFMDASLSVKKCIGKVVEQKPDVVIYHKVKGHMVSNYSSELVQVIPASEKPKQIAFDCEGYNRSLPNMEHMQPVGSYLAMMAAIAPNAETVQKQPMVY